VLLLLFSLPLFALVSYFVLLVCYSAIRLRCKCVIKLSVSVNIVHSTRCYYGKAHSLLEAANEFMTLKQPMNGHCKTRTWATESWTMHYRHTQNSLVWVVVNGASSVHQPMSSIIRTYLHYRS